VKNLPHGGLKTWQLNGKLGMLFGVFGEVQQLLADQIIQCVFQAESPPDGAGGRALLSPNLVILHDGDYTIYLEGKQAVKMTGLSCHRFRSNEVRLWLSVIAYNLGNLWRRIALLPLRIVSQCREQARRMYYGAVFEIKSLLALVVSVGPESKGKDFVAPAGGGVARPASSE
jgi:hypothetical protein